MKDVIVARQPILDRDLDTLGYEMLFRATAQDESADIVDGDLATAQVVSNVVTEIGLDGLVGNRLAFVNVTPRFLTEPMLLECLPPERCVLEILEDVNVTDDIVAGVEVLTDKGYRFALDDFERAGPTAPLLPYAEFVKYDLRQTNGDALSRSVDIDHAAGRRVVVERIETHDDREAAASAGADYFQGYYFARPSTTSVSRIETNNLMLLRLLSQVSLPETTLDDIVEILSQDVAMSVKTLRYVNAAAFGLAAGVESIRQAAVLVGRDVLRSWTILEVMLSLGKTPIELARLALTRAKFCELVARRCDFDEPDAFYTVGMLSLLDAITNAPMCEVVDRIAVGDAIRAALLGSDSPYTAVLSLAVETEQQPGRAPCVMGDTDVTIEHNSASAWATELFGFVTTEPRAQASAAAG